jgi:hypothetical protein
VSRALYCVLLVTPCAGAFAAYVAACIPDARLADAISDASAVSQDAPSALEASSVVDAAPAVDATSDSARAFLCSEIDARSCIDFEPGSSPYGARTEALNVIAEVWDGGARASTTAHRARVRDPDGGESFYFAVADALGALPFDTSLDVQVLSGSSKDLNILQIEGGGLASSKPLSAVVVYARKANAGKYDLAVQRVGPDIGGTLVYLPAQMLALGVSLENSWVTLRAHIEARQITVELQTALGVTSTTVVFPASFDSLEARVRVLSGPRVDSASFEVLIDDFLVQ